METTQRTTTSNPTFVRETITKPIMKTFTASTIEAAEEAVNEWLQLQDVRLLYVAQSQSEQGGRFVFTVSLFYMQQ
ncbi:MAG TPA: hypothetical protein VD794_07550 [Flavisolibacter sp.]|nr:hypothetical protein [Flavisolibacter sp.]